VRYNKLPSSGIPVSEVSLGTHTFSGDGWGKTNDELSIDTIKAALDAGINLIDTAHSYGLGHAEELIGKALRGRREEVVICTKVGSRWGANGKRWIDRSYGSIVESVEQCLKRMKTDYVDLYLLHYPDPDVEIQESMRAMSDLLEKGVIRGVGVSRFSLGQLKEATRYVNISIAQYPLSIFDRQYGLQPGYDEWHSTVPILDFCFRTGIEVMAYGGLAKGLLAGRFTGRETIPQWDWRSKATRFQKGEIEKWISVVIELEPIAKSYGLTLSQFAISWTLSRPGVITSLVGARNPAQIRQNVGAAGWRLKDDDMEEIENIMARAGHCPDFFGE
jgi:aryl-alcohol dehydrogenase-like predicted oxidoreductase